MLCARYARYVIFAFVVFEVFNAANIMRNTVADLDKATAKQCKTHDWPASAHKVHMDWCADNGYKTGE